MNRAKELFKKNGPLISPSLLAADFTQLAAELDKVKGADALHLDIMDGKFVPNISYGPDIVKQLRPLWDKTFDVHLMVDEPEKWVDPFIDAGADILVFHQEATSHPHRLIQTIQERGVYAGISLNPGTPVELIEPLMPFLDMVLLMTVNPGFGGQKYIQEIEDKMLKLRNIIDDSGRDILLQIDGGVGRSNIESAYLSGANFFVAGTSIFKAENPEKEIVLLKDLAMGKA